MDERLSNQSQYHVPTSFANPLLNIEPDTRVSDSLPRSYTQRKHNLQQNQFQQILQQSNTSSSSNLNTQQISPTGQSQQVLFNNNHNIQQNGLSKSKSGIYQKSLNLLTNGVSPLLKKKQQSQHYDNNFIKNSVNVTQSNVINKQNNNINNLIYNNSINSSTTNNQINQLITSPTSPNLSNAANVEIPINRLSGNAGGGTPNINNSISCQNQNNNSNQDKRKSEPIMLSLDPIPNEFDRLQQRQELMLENLNLDFETMLMNGNTVVSNNSNTNHANQNNNMLQIHHQMLLQQQKQFNAQNHLHLQQQHQANLNNVSSNNNVLASNTNDYGRTIQQKQQQNFIQHNTSSPMHASQHIYKEPIYMMYDDPTVQQQKTVFQQQQKQQLVVQQQQHKSAKNDENIYEEVDFMSLSSLRAQYADTLSLQSWKKKGSKRGLTSATSSSFTRWFSTRKKNGNSPSNSTTISNTISNSNSHTDLDENTYIEVKQSGTSLLLSGNNSTITNVNKKQRSPISLPELPSNLVLSTEQLKRRMIIGSIVESENSYISSLQRLINDFKKPLEDASPQILSQNKINIIFYRLEQILQCHSIFGIALNQCIRQWDDKEQIGEVFITSFSKTMVLDIYSEFINNFTNAMETLRKASKSKSAFSQFLQERTASSPDRLSFFGLMVKPVQRFPQFILLLDDLLKHTPSDHHDRMTLQLALTQLESLADRLNERKRDSERHFAVKQLLKDYLSNSTTSSSNRYLLRMDDVYVLDLDASTNLVLKSKCRKLYLLNDMLVCVSIPSNRLKFAVNLNDVDVIDDVTPATDNLIANSVSRTKDPTSNSISPQHCTAQRMYCDLNNLMHDLETLSRISNLICSLRFRYNGLSVELTEQIALEIRNEIRRKDAQITLIDRSCFQLRIRSKNYKDIICVQMSDPEIKKDWLTDIRIAKLALDRDNNPAWDIVSENLSNSTGNINGMTQQRVPLFVKSLAIFATTETSQLTCALFYRLPYQPFNSIQQLSGSNSIPGFYSSQNYSNNGGVLWICNVNHNGSQLGALATNGDDVNLIHSYELCDSHVTCLEHVDCYSVWIGLKQGRVIVIDANLPNEWQQLAALEVAGEVVCMKHVGKHVYVGLKTGVLTLFDITDYEEPIIITLSQQPVTCLLQINNEVFACSGDKIWVINESCQVERSYILNGSNNPKTDYFSSNLHLSEDKTELNRDQLNNNDKELNDLRPNLLAHCGIGLWVSLIDSSIIKLYHTETFKHLQDINVASNAKRVLNEANDIPIVVTSMLATRGLLWIGTSVGIIVTLTLPRLQGVPLVSGCLNVSLHRHLGPVTILLSLTPGAAATSQPNMIKISNRNNGNKSRRNSLESKSVEAESIYGLYADLMKVDDYISDPRSTTTSTASTAVATSIIGTGSNLNLAANQTNQSITNNQNTIHHQLQLQHQLQQKNGNNNSVNTVTNRIAWDLTNMTISDDSTSESASSSAIYHDGIRQNLSNNVTNAGVSQNPLGHDVCLDNNKQNNKTDSISVRTGTNSSQTTYESKRPISAQSSIQTNLLNVNSFNNYNNINSSNSNGNLKANNSNVTSGNNNAIGSNAIYESNNNFNTNVSNTNHLSQHYYGNTSASNANLKTALLITGGNGFKRGTLTNPYSSQHAHCIIWEYKL